MPNLMMLVGIKEVWY